MSFGMSEERESCDGLMMETRAMFMKMARLSAIARFIGNMRLQCCWTRGL
jgi:hypothetical protein